MLSSCVSEPSSDKRSDSVSDDESVTKSETSTIEHGHTPFETFQHQVLALAKERVWVNAATAEITVERLAGGGYNRIIGITWQAQAKPNTNVRFVLRVPRFHAARVDNDVAALLFVQRYTEIPAPRVIVFDEFATNQLNSPYMIQTRLQGTNLHFSMPNLNKKQRYQVARELGGVFCQMLSIRSSKAGRLVLPSDSRTLNAPLYVAPWIQSDTTISTGYEDGPPSETVYGLLINTLQAQKAEELKLRPNSALKPDLITRFMSMAAQLEEAGWLNKCPYSLVHLDLAPRNIMIHTQISNPSIRKPVGLPKGDIFIEQFSEQHSHETGKDFANEQPIISGILDWDSAVLGPMFMSCTPPTWLWDWEGDDSDDDTEVADYLPPSEDGQTLKAIFEEAAGPEFKRFAYQNAYRLARQLFRFTVDGLHSNEHIRAANAMLEEWRGIHLPGRNSIVL